MILIAESGSTKTDWIFIEGSNEISFKSQGYNPQIIDIDFLKQDLKSNIPGLINPVEISQLFFYGAGCSSESSKVKMRNMLLDYFPNATIDVQSDLLAACRALLGNKKGIIGILGTGSNSCYYDGENIIQKSTNLGYLMGDEGSGNEIAQRVIKLCLYNKLDKEISNQIIPKNLSGNEFVGFIYSQDRINRYLASFMPKIYSFRNNPLIHSAIQGSLKSYIENHISIYTESSEVYLTGSIASLFEDELRSIMLEFDKVLVTVLKSPVDALKDFHLQS